MTLGHEADTNNQDFVTLCRLRRKLFLLAVLFLGDFRGSP